MPYNKNRSTTRKLRKSKRGGQTVRTLNRAAVYPSKLPGSLSSPVIRNLTATFTKPTATTQDGQEFSISFPFFKPKTIKSKKGGKTRKIRRKSQRKRQH
jgi:hypothetical protein